MGYVIRTKKVNIFLDSKQQEDVFNVWMNPKTGVGRFTDRAMENFAIWFKEANCANLTLKSVKHRH